MKFKDWFINEVGTSTADVAGFSRITIPLVRRWWVSDWEEELNGKNPKQKKVKDQPQVREFASVEAVITRNAQNKLWYLVRLNSGGVGGQWTTNINNAAKVPVVQAKEIVSQLHQQMGDTRITYQPLG